MKIESIQHAEQVLQKYVPNVRKFLGDGLSLDRMWQLLEAAGNPQDGLKIIHIAGTSGKTSTCYYVTSILQQSGKKVALTVSPHVDRVTERLQINGVEMPEKVFCNDLGEFLEKIKIVPSPSYFEVLISFVFWAANKYGVDYLVLETGMGGLLDATNVAKRADKVCGITDIGYDHMNVLGSSLSEIAEQKAGIIHENNSVFMYKQSDEIMQSINRRVTEKNAALHTFQEKTLALNTKLNLNGLAEFQKRNWLLAEQICNFVAKRDDFTIVVPDAKSITVPARIELVSLSDSRNLIFDGAHNQQKMKVFVSSFKSLYPNQKADILVAFKEGKDYEKAILELSSICKKLIVTTFDVSQDLPAKSQDPEAIVKKAQDIGLSAEVVTDHKLAFQKLINSESSLKLITGSFYLISQIRRDAFLTS